MSRILLFSLLIFCTAAGCTKNNDEPQLPPLTQEGKNILACKVNGQVQIYKGKRTTFNDNGVEYDPYIDKLRIAADNSDYNDNIEMLLPGSPDSVVIGIKYFFSIREITSPYAKYYIGNGSTVYKTRDFSGFIQFTRRDKEVAAGIFEFTAYYNNDSIKITEGRFDITNP